MRVQIPMKCVALQTKNRDKKVYGIEGGKDMAWIIGAAVFTVLFLTAVYVVAGIAVSVAGSYQTD